MKSFINNDLVLRLFKNNCIKKNKLKAQISLSYILYMPICIMIKINVLWIYVETLNFLKIYQYHSINCFCN